MPMFTPGVTFLSEYVLLRVGVPALALIGIHRLQLLPIPTWKIIQMSGLSAVLYGFYRVVVDRVRQNREVQKLGARLAPKIVGKLPGRIDLMRNMIKGLEKGYIGDGIQELFNDDIGHTVLMSMLWDGSLWTNDPDSIKTVLVTDFPNFVKGNMFKKAFESFLGNGVFNSDGDMWKFHRSMTRPFFSRERITHFDIFDKHAEDTIEKIKLRLREGYSVDFQDVILRFTLDSSTEFLFGTCVQSLEATLPYPYFHPSNSPSSTVPKHPSDIFASAFRNVQHTTNARTYSSWAWPLSEIFKDKTADDMKIVDGFVEPIVRAAVDRTSKTGVNSVGDVKEKEIEEVEDGESLLDHLVKLTSDPKILKDETLNILIAGRDTTATVLTFTVYFLAAYPHVFSRLKEEVLSTVGPSRRPTFDDIRGMKYMRAVINETLRLYPPVPINVRTAVNATVFPSHDPNEKPIYIPAGTRVPYSVLIMQRRKDLWGPDADEFDPDRFLDDRLKNYLTPNPFIFLPFNAGPRICLGQQFAYNEMSFFLIRLLQNFSEISLDMSSSDPATRPPKEWEGAPGRKGIEKIWPKTTITLYVNGGLWLKMNESNL